MSEKIFVATLAKQEEILSAIKGQRPKRYGYRVKIAEANPASRVEYLFDAVGMTPAAMNFATGVFNYGSWGDVWFIRDNYPCMVKSNGTEDYRLNPGNYAKKAHNDAASDVSNQGYDGNAMAAIPLVWAKRYQEDGYQYVIFCETQYDDGYKAHAHTRADGSVSDVAYHAAFKGSLVSNKLRSIAGTYPQHSANAQQEIAYAQANGAAAGWNIRTWSMHELIADLLTLISKNMNAQAAFGCGNMSGYDGANTTTYGMCQCGSIMNKGQFFSTNVATGQVKVFHIEGFWGDRWDRLAGLIYQNGVWKAKMTPEGGGYNLTGDGYASACAGVAHALDEAFGGWQKETYQSEHGRFPTGTTTGSDTTYECDHFWASNTITAVVLAGATCAAGWGCGPRSLNASSVAAGAAWFVGASLSLVGPSS